MYRQEHLSEVLYLCVFVTSHVSLTLYSFDFHKYSDVSCCGVKHSLSRFQVLATHRQPSARPEKDHEGHFLSSADAQARILGEAAFIDIEELPLNTVDTRNGDAKVKVRCDKKII